MTERVDQLIIGITSNGMQLVASSIPSATARTTWHHRLREHARLLSGPEHPPPAVAFNHLDFGDGTAAVLRRFALPNDAGRGVAHAIIGDSVTIERLVPRLTSWNGWQGEHPPDDQMDALWPGDFPSTSVQSEVDEGVLRSVLAEVQSAENCSFTIIGVPDESRLPIVWRIREALPDQKWTFSTYERNDVPRDNLPRLVFVSEPPANPYVEGAGRKRMNVADPAVPDPAIADTAVPGHRQESSRPVPDEQPTMVIRPVTAAVPPPPVVDDGWHRAVRDKGPMRDGLNRLADLVQTMSAGELRERALTSIADPQVRQSYAFYLAECLTPFDREGADKALGRRTRAVDGMYEPPAVTAPAPPARPEVDPKLVGDAWHRQLQWSARAGRAKTKVVVYRALGVIALVVGAIGAVLASQLAQVDKFWMTVVGVTTAMVVSAGTWLRTSREPKERQQWVDARRASEEIKSELCTYLVGAGRYDSPEAPALLKKVLARHEGVSGPVRHQEQPRIRDMESYLRERVTGQIDYHKTKADRYEDALEIAKYVEVGFGLAAALLSLLAPLWGQDIAVWAGVCTAIAGIVAAHITQIGYQRLCARYRKTVKELQRLRDDLPDDPDHAARDAFVAACERVLVEQNDDWHAHLTPLAGKEQP